MSQVKDDVPRDLGSFDLLVTFPTSIRDGSKWSLGFSFVRAIDETIRAPPEATQSVTQVHRDLTHVGTRRRPDAAPAGHAQRRDARRIQRDQPPREATGHFTRVAAKLR